MLRKCGLLGLLAAVLALVLAGCGGASSGGASASAKPATAGASQGAALAPTKPTSDLPTVTVAKLPAEAVTTLTLVRNGGPYPYSRDGVTFENREGLLPKKSSGYYQEYTVVTPGESDRGARRIIAAKDGARFYTDDHYDSFREVIQS